MRKITSYVILEHHNERNLAREVNKWIKEGWQPYGSLTVIPATEDIAACYVQAIVEYDEAEEEAK